VCDAELGCVPFPCATVPGNPCPDPATCDEGADTCGGCRPPTVVGAGGRYLDVTPDISQGEPVAIMLTGDCRDPAVSCVSLDAPLYVQDGVCVGGSVPGEPCVADSGCPGGVCKNPIGPEPVFKVWSEWETIHVHGIAIRPETLYRVYAVCDRGEGNLVASAPAVGSTWAWGDIDHNGDINFLDVSAVIDVWRERPGAAAREAVDLVGCEPNRIVNFLDISAAIDAWAEYPFWCEGWEHPCP
jgi:hypothetical protein